MHTWCSNCQCLLLKLCCSVLEDRVLYKAPKSLKVVYKNQTICHRHHHNSWAQCPLTSNACFTVFCQLLRFSAKCLSSKPFVAFVYFPQEKLTYKVVNISSGRKEKQRVNVRPVYCQSRDECFLLPTLWSLVLSDCYRTVWERL